VGDEASTRGGGRRRDDLVSKLQFGASLTRAIDHSILAATLRGTGPVLTSEQGRTAAGLLHLTAESISTKQG
jgi:hypothetical protein